MTLAYRLPWVPAPCPGEWLGYWLLRVGGVYGMHLRELLALAGVSEVRFVEPTWARLGCRPLLDWSSMAVLLGEALPRLKRMYALTSPPSRWAQLGCCPGCLRSDLREGRTPYWRRAWMDPYVAVCWRHRRPLRPIESNVVRPQVELHRCTRLLSELADDDTPRDGPVMTPQEIRALSHLQAQLRPGRSPISLCPTGAALLQRRVDTVAADLVRTDADDPVEFVHAPRFGGWLACVRNLHARQRLLQGVVRRAANDGASVIADVPAVESTLSWAAQQNKVGPRVSNGYPKRVDL